MLTSILDTFALNGPNGTNIPISTTGIAWPNDKKYKFLRPENY